MLKISACVITKNEAENIERCLRSLKGSVNEIIVVDTGSTDDTVKIAKKFGAKVFYFEWINDFAAARNFAIAKAKGDWIVFPDADEYIRADRIANLRPLLEKIHGNREFDAVSCMMEHTDGVDGPLRACDRTVRIFRNLPAIRYKRKIHESIYKNGQSVHLVQVPDTMLVLRHTGYAAEKCTEKLARNHVLLEESLQDGSADGLTYYYLGHSYWVIGLHAKAVEYAQQALEAGQVASTMFAHRVYAVLIQSMCNLDCYGPTDIEPLIAEAVAKFPHHPEVMECRSYYQLKRGSYTQALESLQQSLAANACYKDVSLANEFVIRIFQVYRAIAEIYDKMNDPVKALEHYVQAVKSKKDDAETFDGLISLVRPQKAADIVWLINSLYDLSSAKNVEFLVHRLAALREKRIFAYYEKIWAERFGRKDLTAMKFLLSGHYAQAIPLFAAAYSVAADKATELMIAVAALLGEQAPDKETLGIQLEPAYQRIIAAVFRPERGAVLAAEDFPYYLELVNNSLYIANDSQLKKLLALSSAFPEDDALAQVAAVLEDNKLYILALEYYVSQIGRAGQAAEQLGKLLFKAGFCCYKLKSYAEAVNLLSEALAAGYDGQDIREYLAWSFQQCGTAAVREKVAALQTRYDLFPEQAAGPENLLSAARS